MPDGPERKEAQQASSAESSPPASGKRALVRGSLAENAKVRLKVNLILKGMVFLSGSVLEVGQLPTAFRGRPELYEPTLESY